MSALPPFDCIVGYHMNPLTCGVAKFNAILGERLGVPVIHVFDPALASRRTPLLSIKGSEFSDGDLARLQAVVRDLPSDCAPWFFLHGFDNLPAELDILRRAEGVYCGSRKIHADVSPLVARTRALWSPSTLRPTRAPDGKAEVRLFSFGMAHKLRTGHYLRLRDLLEAGGRSYSISLSAALHEGTSFEEGFSAAFDELHGLFADRVRFQGFLSDDAVLDQLRRSNFFVAFFETGVRDNNSSVIAAMEQGCVVITNLDADSPGFLRHGETVLDIGALHALPTDPATLNALSTKAREAVRGLTWDRLLAGLAL